MAEPSGRRAAPRPARPPPESRPMSADEIRHEVWRGRIAGELHPTARALNDSLPFDRRLWPEELALTRAYAPALVECGVMSAADAEALAAACESLSADLES